jgi:hypothetical protein
VSKRDGSQPLFMVAFSRALTCFMLPTPAVAIALAKVLAIATIEARGAEVAVVVLVAVAKVLSIATVVAGVSVV